MMILPRKMLGYVWPNWDSPEVVIFHDPQMGIDENPG
jgi:hypothetical protein